MPYPGAPSQFPAQSGGTITGSTGATGIGFGFPAGYMRFVVDSGGPAYLNLRSTSSASTGDTAIVTQTSGDQPLVVEAGGFACSGFCVSSTTTVLSMRYAAWG